MRSSSSEISVPFPTPDGPVITNTFDTAGKVAAGGDGPGKNLRRLRRLTCPCRR